MKTLQPSELDTIKKELINQKVEYIEIIEELTDHIATGIERQWTDSDYPITFEEALQNEIIKFGDKGLRKIQNRVYITKAQEYYIYLINKLMNYFTSLRVFGIIALLLSIYALLIISNQSLLIASFSKVILTGSFAVFNTIIVVDCIKHYFTNRFKAIESRLLLIDVYSTILFVLSLMTYILFFHIDFKQLPYKNHLNLNSVLLIQSIIYTLITVIQYCTLYNLKPKYLKDRGAVEHYLNT
ncbi:hypothetical protein HX017_07095 [Myroides marinus]|uniref:hypothetical protein n=1 Tax=Myroides TaxID=76831 RepID=UPI000741F201|nr:hypothetical protein [Myroides marinus]KUF44281.1 hypothetical protein AS361_00670 [Myroides marinus]MDM1346596.1 hypothetical protein [Myroides marinus]MDM1350001.1 hypothetical protein [Myroides marinus]MDM1353508.1 hypothetical protein [Myroides marinus]MDM1357208.1 hypothetical protein [Myroides marinus]